MYKMSQIFTRVGGKYEHLQKGRCTMKRKIPMVVTYSFDADVPVWLFDSEKEAAAEIKKQYEEELQIAKENWGDSVHIEHRISEDGSHAEIKEFFSDRTDVTTWTVGDIKN